MTPMPPCGPSCPRRSINPNCHDPDTCPKWRAFLEKKAARDAVIRRERQTAQLMDSYAKERSRRARNRKEHGDHAE